MELLLKASKPVQPLQTCPTLLPAPGRKQGWALLKRPKTLGFPGGGEAARGGGAEFGTFGRTAGNFSSSLLFLFLLLFCYVITPEFLQATGDETR